LWYLIITIRLARSARWAADQAQDA
jgi:hypothetical protein